MYSNRTVSSDTQQEQASRHLGRSLKKPFMLPIRSIPVNISMFSGRDSNEFIRFIYLTFIIIRSKYNFLCESSKCCLLVLRLVKKLLSNLKKYI